MGAFGWAAGSDLVSDRAGAAGAAFGSDLVSDRAGAAGAAGAAAARGAASRGAGAAAAGAALGGGDDSFFFVSAAKLPTDRLTIVRTLRTNFIVTLQKTYGLYKLSEGNQSSKHATVALSEIKMTGSWDPNIWHGGDKKSLVSK